MSLELRHTSRHFYCRLAVNGKRRVFPLTTKYEGTPPKGLRISNKGDAEFERSRGRALEEEQRLCRKLQRPDSEVKLRKRVFETLTKTEFETVEVSGLYELSAKFTRRRTWSPRYADQVRARHERFVEFLRTDFPHVENAHQVTRRMAEIFLNRYQEETNCSAKTLNDVKTSLQGLWTVAEKLELLEGNPFRNIATRHYLTTTKEVFTTEQIEKIVTESRKDPELHAVIVTALSTGMRLVDCCCLEWTAVKTGRRMISVPAQKKTMKPAEIPLFGLLEELIAEAREEAADERYVFPRARILYRRDRQFFTRAFSSLLLRVGFTDDDNPETAVRISSPGGGCRRRPVRSFHGLRTTWMTMALNGGVSLEDVKKICGNVDAETILKHYFQSDGDRIRAKLKATMPPVLGGEGSTDPRLAAEADGLLDLLDQMNGQNWRIVSQELFERIQSLRNAS